MKKIALAAAICAALLSVSSCSQAVAPSVYSIQPDNGTQAPETVVVTVPAETVVVTVPVTVPVSPDETTATASTETGAVTETEAPKGFGYTIVTETRDLGNGCTASLKYPQLENTGNAAAEKDANNLLSDMALGLFSKSSVSTEYAEKIAGGTSVKLEIKDCTVTYCASALMCVRFEAVYTESNDEHTFLYALLLNPSTGSQIESGNVFVKTATIKPSVTSVLNMLTEEGKSTRISATSGFAADVSEWVTQKIKNSIYGKAPQLYFTDTALIIIVEESETQGGYAEYSIPLENVKQYLKVSP